MTNGLDQVNRALQLDAYDAKANFLAGTLYRALGRTADARDAFGWAARSTAYRSAAYAQLAEIMIGEGEFQEAARYARLAIDFDRHSVPGWQALAVIGRKTGDEGLAEEALGELLAMDPLNHFAKAERLLAAVSTPQETAGAREAALAFWASLDSEYPEQSKLELAITYANLGLREDAAHFLEIQPARGIAWDPAAVPSIVNRAWLAWLWDDPFLVRTAQDLDFAFPYRPETLPVLEWASRVSDDWGWEYLLALNLWALDRTDEAASHLESLGQAPDFGPAYVARAYLSEGRPGRENPEADLRRAVELAPENRILHIHLIRHYQDQDQWDAALQAHRSRPGPLPRRLQSRPPPGPDPLERGPGAGGRPDPGRHPRPPSENSRESHRLYEQAHTLVALDALEAGDFPTALEHLTAALEWPEIPGPGTTV